MSRVTSRRDRQQEMLLNWLLVWTCFEGRLALPKGEGEGQGGTKRGLEPLTSILSPRQKGRGGTTARRTNN